MAKFSGEKSGCDLEYSKSTLYVRPSFLFELVPKLGLGWRVGFQLKNSGDDEGQQRNPFCIIAGQRCCVRY